MKQIHDQLNMSITNAYQIDSHNRQPNAYVYVHNRFYGKENDLFRVKMGRLPGVLSVSANWDGTATTGSFTIVAQNKDGLLSPDYHLGKTPSGLSLRGHLDSPWRGQLLANTKIEIHWGYGEYLVREMTGLIDEVEINAEAQTISLRGRSMKKLLIDNTITPLSGQKLLIPDKTTKVETAIARAIKAAGLELVVTLPVIDEESGEPYLVGEAMGKRGEAYYDIVNPMLESTFFILFENPDGTVEMWKKPKFSQSKKADYVVDDQVNITELDYNNKDLEIFGTVLVEAPNGSIDAFSSGYISKRILNGYRREKVVKYPWTTTQKKRQLAAASEFVNMLHEFRTITVTILANPALQLWDSIRIQERISTAQWNYFIKGISTTLDDNGFVQQLECPSNFDFDVRAGSLEDLGSNEPPNITTKAKELQVTVWDMGPKDFDIISIYLNGKLMEGNIILTQEPQTFSFNMKKKGTYKLKFVGISAGRTSTLHFGYGIQDEDGNPLHAPASFEMPRENVKKYGYYQNKKRPSKTVVIKKNG